jgi:alpha-tubulin suppressor-like RCC1 family protein
MPNQFNSPEGDLENYFVSESWLIDQWVGDTLWTWGRNDAGQLGVNDTNTRCTPVTTFAGGTNWKQVSGAGYFTAAIKTDGTLWTWGRNTNGQLGNNTSSNRSTPLTTFAGGTDWKQVSGGGYHTVAIKTDGTLWTWGRNTSGQLGDNTIINRSTPVTTFAGGTDWKQVSGAGYFTAAIKTDGTLWTWGRNTNGQLGDNTIINRSTPVTTFAGGTDWKQVAGGSAHTVAIKTDGTLWTWGNNGSGNLGDNTIINRSTPVTTFAGGTNWKQVSGGGDFTAAIKTDGTLWTWGRGIEGQLGDNTIINRSTPVTTITGGTNWKQVAGGSAHTVAIKTDGTLWTWGNNGSGRLGDNTIINRSTPVTTFSGGTNWKQVAGGVLGTHVAAIKTDGTLWTWGDNTGARLGDDTAISRSTPVTTFAGGTNWKQVAGGGNFTAAIKTDGTLWTWGTNYDGQLGRSRDIAKRLTPVTTFAGGTNWADTATSAPEELYTLSGGNYTVAIKTDGTLWTWGNNAYGELGNNTTTFVRTPVTTFAGGTNWKQVSAGQAVFSGEYTAAIKTDGTLWIWGSNSQGQLGNNTMINRSTPVTTFAGGTNWKQVSCTKGGTFDMHTAAIKTDGTLWTWGRNNSGQLGDNTINSLHPRSTPVTTFAGGTNWKQVACGHNHTAAIKTDGTLWLWGSGQLGQLGNNTTTNRLTPVTTFVGGTNWKQVACANAFTAAIKTDGTLWIWGDNNYAQLGTNNITTRSIPVTTFAGGTNWKQVDCGTGHTAAIKTDGTLWTWGLGGYGSLGDNTIISRSTPVTTFAGGTNWKQVACGHGHTVALNDDGVNKRLYVWGDNNYAQLGTNWVTQDRLVLQTFAGGTNWKQVSTGNLHTAAIKTDGTLWTWGQNTSGQLGDNTIINRSTPVTTITGGTNWKQVSGGFAHTVAVTSGTDPTYFIS